MDLKRAASAQHIDAYRAMDWVHCNSCFFQPGQVPKRDFFLTSCGHIFCQCCERPGTIEQCKICSIKCTTTPLTANMIPEVQMYFEDPESDIMEKLTKVMQFQKSHRQRLNENYRKVIVKYQNLKIAYQTQEAELKRAKNELEKYKRPHNFNMTLPQPQSLPLFCKNSHTSKVIRSGNSQSGISSSPFFVTPSQIRPGSSPQLYRHQNAIPSPLSDISSNSPASVTSNYRGSMSRLNSLVGSQQQSYKPNLTPPISSLRLMSVTPHTPKHLTRY